MKDAAKNKDNNNNIRSRIKRGDTKDTLPSNDDNLSEQDIAQLIASETIKIREDHNLKNVLAANQRAGEEQKEGIIDGFGNEVKGIIPDGWGSLVKVTLDRRDGSVQNVERVTHPRDTMFASRYIGFLEKSFGEEIDEKLEKKEKDERRAAGLRDDETKEQIMNDLKNKIDESDEDDDDQDSSDDHESDVAQQDWRDAINKARKE